MYVEARCIMQELLAFSSETGFLLGLELRQRDRLVGQQVVGDLPVSVSLATRS